MKPEQLRKLIKLIIKESHNLEKMNEAVSPKNQALIEKWMKEVGNRQAAYKMVNSVVKQKLMIGLEDLPDTATLSNGLDDIEGFLDGGDFQAALRAAFETAKEFIEEEGGEGLFEGFRKDFSGGDQKIYKDRQGGQDVYWMDDKDSGGKIRINPENVKRYLQQGYRLIDMTVAEGGQHSIKDLERFAKQEKNPYVRKSMGMSSKPKSKDDDMDWQRIKKSIDKGTLGENDGAGGQNPLDGKSNKVAADIVNRVLSQYSKGLFSDNSWEAINNVFKKLQELGVEVTVGSAKYGGHADTGNGMPKYKEWQITIPFTNNKGKPTQLVGQITAHGAGSVEQPLDKYDISTYVTAVALREGLLKKELTEGKWGSLMAALLIGYGASKTPALKQFINTPQGRQVAIKATQLWSSVPQAQQTVNTAKQIWSKVMTPSKIQNPNQPLPDEKDMDSWDLSKKYTDRNSKLDIQLQPLVKKYLPPHS